MAHRQQTCAVRTSVYCMLEHNSKYQQCFESLGEIGDVMIICQYLICQKQRNVTKIRNRFYSKALNKRRQRRNVRKWKIKYIQLNKYIWLMWSKRLKHWCCMNWVWFLARMRASITYIFGTSLNQLICNFAFMTQHTENTKHIYLYTKCQTTT